MKDRAFIDTNVLVYANTTNNAEKQRIANLLFDNLSGMDVFISTQVLGELYSVLTKNKTRNEDAILVLRECITRMNVVPVTLEVVEKCILLKERYRYSYWDSLILSAAVLNGCSIVYSEDMSNGQIIDGSLTIINPFT